MLKFLGTFLMLAGLMAIAGSAGDCDGDCMEYANSLEQMMIICLVGFSMMATGGYILYKENV